MYYLTFILYIFWSKKQVFLVLFLRCIVFSFLYILDTFILCRFVVYLYSFDRFFGFDKVCILAENTSKKKVKSGDLLVFGNQYFLALGENLAFAEQYQHLTTTQAELVYKEFLSAPALKLFHWMVETYYTTYKSVVRLFFADDIEKLLERETKVKGKKTEFEIWNLEFERNDRH